MDNLIAVIDKFAGYLKVIAPSLAILALMVQGIKFYKGDGNSKAEAKDNIFWILVGLAIVFTAAVLVAGIQKDMGW